MKKILIVFICLFSFPLVSQAATCSKEYESEIKARARNVNFVYQLQGINRNVATYKITITNLHPDMVIYERVSNGKGNTYSANNFKNGTLDIVNAQSGTHSFTIYSKTCASTVSSIASKSITLPTYNAYSQDENCNGLESYSICQRWSGYNKDKATFEKEIKEIKEKKTTVDNNTEDKNKKDDEKISFYKLLIQYWYILLLAMIVAVCVYYLIAANSKKKEFNFKV